MKTTQIDISQGEVPNDLLTGETLQEIRFTFDLDHVFPRFQPQAQEVKDDRPPQGLFARFKNWLLRGRSVRRDSVPDVGGGEPDMEDL